ncbi:MAG: helix-turn-helix domain-containing protein [Bacillaceae bacterium]|nr:helix-turn-helix domain-containing protein [Bacillaceae bacterium]
MINVKEQEQEKLWDSILTLASIDKEQAKVVLKVVIERSLRSVGIFTPFVSSIPLKLPDHKHVEMLKSLEKQVIKHLTKKEEDKAYELLVEYIDVLSDLTESDSKIIRRRLIASILKDKSQRTASGAYRLAERKAVTSGISFSEETDVSSYYTPKEVSKKLGVSDQTVRRMCDRGRFPGAYQTDGGHWRIPKDSLVTTEAQDRKAEEVLQNIDAVNKEAGDVDEFDL